MSLTLNDRKVYLRTELDVKLRYMKERIEDYQVALANGLVPGTGIADVCLQYIEIVGRYSEIQRALS